MNNPTVKKNMGNDPRLKEAYFDAYYHMTWCYYKHSQTEKVKAAGKEAAFLAKAVDYILPPGKREQSRRLGLCRAQVSKPAAKRARFERGVPETESRKMKNEENEE